MILLPEKKAVLLRLRDPARVTTVIPSAREVMYQGKPHIAVPHQIEVVQVLRNIGIQVPSPILSYYDWPGRFQPFEHQKEVAQFLTLYNRAFNLSDLGTGKTLATLWAYDYLRSRGVRHKAIVITPLSTLERTWADELFNHFPHLTHAVLHGSWERRLKLLEQDVDLYLINHDGIKVSGLVEALASRDDIDLVIVDEIAQVARTAGADRFKALNTIINRQVPRAAWGLTGTPIPNAPTDAWAQCKLLVPERVPLYFKRFKEQVMRQVGPFTWLPRDNALDTVKTCMQPAIRFHRDDCIDLPPCVFQTREAVLTAEQSRVFKEMMNQLVAEAAEGQITAVNEAIKGMRLIQIALGVAYAKDGASVVLDCKPRLEVIADAVAESNSKAIVFSPFVGAIPVIQEHLENAGHTVECIHGGVSKNERDRIIGAFQKAADPQVLVCQPASMSHGITLTAASTIIWAAPITSNDTFEQANARITRPGQRHSQLIVLVEGTPIERKYYERLRKKQAVQGTLLDMVKADRTLA